MNFRITLFTSLATPPASAGVKAMLYSFIKPEFVWARGSDDLARCPGKPCLTEDQVLERVRDVVVVPACRGTRLRLD